MPELTTWTGTDGTVATQTGTTEFGDPEVLVTIGGKHPKAGLQLLFKSTASMDHIPDPDTRGGKVCWLAFDYPQRPNGSGPDGWHGSLYAKDVMDLLPQVVEYADWLHQREQVRDQIWTGAIYNRLERFDRAMGDTSALDYVREWESVLVEVARIQLVMATVKAEVQ